MTEALVRGRAAYARHAWADAHAALATADAEHPLGADDLDLFASSAYLLGRDEEGTRLWEREYHARLEGGDGAGAARAGFWIGFALFHRGEAARAGGWLARAQRILEAQPDACVERGYVLLPMAIVHVQEGEYSTGYALAGQVVEIGEHFADVDLVTIARTVQGRALVRLGKTTEGVGLLDEAMVAVTAGEVSAIVAGDVYCTVIEGCVEVFDLHRAAEWTSALTRWCDAQPDLVPYSGQCLVHRAQVLQRHGAWDEAQQAARRACERFEAAPWNPAVGEALYQEAELHRLRGTVAEAEQAYTRAAGWGREPQPGLALLRLAQGRLAAAQAGVGRALEEAQDRVDRAPLLTAAAEVALACDDVAAARVAVDELGEIATDVGADLLRATAAHTEGAVLLAEGDAQAALGALRRASTLWQQLGTPYEAARTRLLVGEACARLGDEDAARMEADAACRVLRELGARPDLARAQADTRGVLATRAPGGLTAREVEVLRLVASGRTNRAIADMLVLSEKTVARHVSNILLKLGLPSRAAATAYAYEHDLV